ITNRINAEAADNVRTDFWSAVLQQLSPAEWIFGSGLGNFSNLSRNAGYEFYAHSVYVDILVSMGIVGLSLFVFAKIYFFINSVKNQSVLGISLLFYIIFSFATHGNISSKY